MRLFIVYNVNLKNQDKSNFILAAAPNRVHMWEATWVFQCKTSGANSERGAVSSIGLNFVSGFGCIITGTLKAGQSATIAAIRTVVALGLLTSFSEAGKEFGRVRDNLYVLALSVCVIGIGILRIVSLGLSGPVYYVNAKEILHGKLNDKLAVLVPSTTDGKKAEFFRALSLREVKRVIESEDSEFRPDLLSGARHAVSLMPSGAFREQDHENTIRALSPPNLSPLDAGIHDTLETIFGEQRLFQYK